MVVRFLFSIKLILSSISLQKETIATDSATISNWKQNQLSNKNVKIYSISPLINAWGYLNIVAQQDNIW